MFKEFGFDNGKGFVRNILKDESYEQEFAQIHEKVSCYSTFMSYDVEDQELSKLKAPFVFDLDSDNDIEKAKEETKKIIKLLAQIDVRPEVFFSGAKGFHVVVPFECLGIEPRFNLVSVYKILAKGLADTNNLSTVDFKIYERRRLFRIPNTVNTKTGLYKVRLEFDELNLSVDEIKGLAKTKRDNLSSSEPSSMKVSEKLKAEYLRREKAFLDKTEKKMETRICSLDEVKMRPCIRKLLEEGASAGERNDTCYTMALFFKSQNLLEDDAVETLNGFSGLSESEVQRTVRSAYKSSHRWGCNENELVQKYCDKDRCPIGFQRKILADLVWDKDALVEELGKEERGEFNTNLTFGLDDFESAWGGIRKDELIVIASDAGIGKTTFAIWLAKQNLKKGNRILFCSLEMATRSLLARNCAETGTSFTEMKEWVKENPIYFYKDGQRLSTKNLRGNLEESIKSNFGIDLIVIDHLGYVEKSADNLYDSVSQIVEDLASFAKDLSIPVMLLTHFNKGQAGASNKPRSVNDILGSGRVRDFASKVVQIWYPQEENEFNETAFLLHKNRYGNCKTVKLKYEKGGYVHNEFII